MRLEEYYTIQDQRAFQDKISEHISIDYRPIGIVVVPISENTSSAEFVPGGKTNKIQISNQFIDQLIQEEIITPKL